jgi:hypothetical protein
MQKSTVIEISKGEVSPIDNGILDDIFNVHQAISQAESKFWDMGLAKSANLGKVVDTETAWQIEFLYPGKK